MNIVVSGRHVDVSPAMKEHAENKANKLLQYWDRIQEIEVIYDTSKDQMQVEIIVNAEHKKEFIAHHSEPDLYTCVNACVEKLERQLTEHKKKIRNRKHPEGASTTIRHEAL